MTKPKTTEPKKLTLQQLRRLPASALAQVRGGITEIGFPACDGSAKDLA